jgi:prevent-host-death family protein
MKSQHSNRSPHAREWQLQEAKNRLSQVLDSALRDGPQTITLRGKPTAVLVSF